MGKLRDQMLMDLQLSGAKPRTQETYLREVENLVKYFNRSPAELGEAEHKAVHALHDQRAAPVRGDIPVLCCRAQVFLQNNAEAGMAGGKDQASPEQEKTTGCAGPLGGGIHLFGHQEPQAQGDTDDDVFFGIESERNGPP